MEAENNNTPKEFSRCTLFFLNLMLLLGSLVVAYLLCELSVRLFEERIIETIGAYTYLPETDDSVMCVDLHDDTRFPRFAWDEKGDNVVHVHSDNPLMVYELRPSSYVSTHIQTNAYGFRDREFSVARTPGVYRICIVGDSITFGWLLKRAELYPTILEELLNGWAAAPQPFEVYNLAIDGYNAEQEAELIRTKVLPLQPDLMVIGFCANDDQIGADAGLWRHFSRGPSRTLDFMRLKWRQLHANLSGDGMLDRCYDKIAKLCAEADLPWCLLLFPHADDPFDHSAQMMRIADRLKIPALDLRPAYEPVGLAQLLPDGTHPSAQGHRIAAESLFAFLKKAHEEQVLDLALGEN